jgi:diaminopimelate decarboxylase
MHLWPDTAAITAAGHLSIAGSDVVALARQYGTPLYLFDEQTIRAICRAYHAAFANAYAGEVDLHYASKALLNSAIAVLVAGEGLGLDVVSGGELFVALRAGVAPGRLRLHGNAKPRVELEQAIAAGIGQIVIDNLDELALVARLARGRHVPLAVGLRLTPNIVPDTHHHIQTGQADSKFGLPLDGLEAAGALLRSAPGLRLVALHAHLGSQIVDTAPYRAAVGVLLDCAVRLRAACGLTVEEINLGGGLGVAYHPGDPQPSLEQYAQAIAQALSDGCAARGLAPMRLAVEPGRSIVARAGVALYEVLARKPLLEGYGASGFVHIDGGMADNIRPSLYAARYWALLANRAGEARTTTVHVAGRYCESGDILMRNVALPEARPGDLLAVAVSGAYTLSMASNYNLVPRPAVLLLRDGQVQVAQRRETYDDLVARDGPL